MLFVNYVLDLNNGLEQRLFGVVWTITMKCTKLRTPSYWWAMMIKMSTESYIIEDSWMNNYNYESLLYFCVCILYSKMLWNGSIIYLFIITCIRLFQCTQCLELVYALAGLKIDEFSRAKMDAMAKELIGEASFTKSCLNEQWTHLPLENEEDLINIWI